MRVDLLILAGGFGTRLKKIVPDLPKPLAPIAGDAFLDRQIRFFRKFLSIDQIILAIGYKKEMILEKYKDENMLFSEESSPLGTGGALKKGALLSQKKCLLVANGDSFLDCDVDDFLKFHQENQADFTLCSVYQQDAKRYGRIEEESGRIKAFLEKSDEPKEGYINAGLYLINQSFISEFPDGAFSLEEKLQTLLDKRIFSYPVSGFFLDIGTEESYRQAQGLQWLSKF